MGRKSGSYYNELVARCRRGDEESWQELIDLVSPVVFSLAQQSHLTRDESFDIFGQVCSILVEHIDDLRSSERLMAYVNTITRRRIFNYFRSIDRLERMPREVMEEIPESTPRSPEHELEQEQQRIRLITAMTELPERDYKLLWALYFDPEEPSYSDIGQLLNMPESSIGPTRARALQKLAEILKKKENPST